MVAWIRVLCPTIERNCLGFERLLRGQNRLPIPPAMITAWIMSEGDGANPVGGGALWDFLVGEETTGELSPGF